MVEQHCGDATAKPIIAFLDAAVKPMKCFVMSALGIEQGGKIELCPMVAALGRDPIENRRAAWIGRPGPALLKTSGEGIDRLEMTNPGSFLEQMIGAGPVSGVAQPHQDLGEIDLGPDMAERGGALEIGHRTAIVLRRAPAFLMATPDHVPGFGFALRGGAFKPGQRSDGIALHAAAIKQQLAIDELGSRNLALRGGADCADGFARISGKAHFKRVRVKQDRL